MRSGSIATSSSGGSDSASGRCRMIPSSDHSACVSMPCCSRSSARSASPQGACTLGAEGREDAQAPVADLVAEALDDDRAVGGQDAGRELLLAQVLDERARGALVAGVQARQPLHGALVVERRELALQAADGAAELERAGPPARPSRTAPAPAGRARGRRSRGRARSARSARPTRRAGTPGPRAPRAPSPRRARRRARRRPRGRRRRARGRGSCPRSRSRSAARPRVRAARPSCAPRRCAAAARRTRPRGSGRRAGRARSRAARA